jgi:hypothetical protein
MEVYDTSMVAQIPNTLQSMTSIVGGTMEVYYTSMEVYYTSMVAQRSKILQSL